MSNKIEFTESAKKEIARVISEKGPKMYFRISVQGGGCSGPVVGLGGVASAAGGDRIVGAEGRAPGGCGVPPGSSRGAIAPRRWPGGER